MRILYLFAVLLLFAGLASSAFVVQEPEQVILTRFGKPVGNPISTPGLKFKVPIIDTVHTFDKRFLEFDGKVTQVPTKEKRFILVNTYARWRITDPLQFFQRLRDEAGAQARLDGIINGETRDAVASHDLVELVRSTNREPLEAESQLEDEGSVLEPIQYGRDAVRKEIQENVQKRVKESALGIEVLDVRFKRINYVDEVQQTVYKRMIAERRRIADRFRSEGEGEASRIRGEKERDLKQIQSEAYRQAQEIVGRADAEAAEIYASAYNQSPDARQFYEFLKTMETYGKTFDKETLLLLSTDGDFLRYLKDSGP